MKKVIPLLLALILVLTSVYADNDMDKQEELLKEVQEKLNELDKEHSSAKQIKNKVVKNIRSLESSVRNTEKEIDKLTYSIDDNVVKVDIATKNLVVAKQKLKETNELLDTRIRIMYMNGTVGYAEVLLESDSFQDLLSRIEMLTRIINADTMLISQMEEDKKAVEEKKAKLLEEQENLKNLKKQMEERKADLEGQIEQLKKEKQKLLRDMRALEIQIDSTNKDAQKIKKILKEMKLRAKYTGGKMTWPVPSSYRVTSPFGMRRHPIFKVMKLHTGIDIGGAGREVVAVNNGTVIHANWLGGYGKCIMIDHGGGIVTLYAHNQKIFVRKGQKVKRGQKISLTGSTGNVTGPHLHFEVRVNGEYVDPLKKYLKK